MRILDFPPWRGGFSFGDLLSMVFGSNVGAFARPMELHVKATRLRCESLEDRHVPATFGIPWPDANLSVSFASDGTTIAGRTSNLFSSLNSDASTNEWQQRILSAFYQWSVHANVNIAVVPDGGQAFGTPGRLQNDPRFGDIRIGGNRLANDVLAVTSPSDPGLSGSLSGDVFVNTSFRFTGQPYDLTRVMLHEAGHAFGLDHSTDPQSPLYPRFNNPIGGLTSGDIAAIRALYGRRLDDRFEKRSGNEALGTSAPLPVPTNYAGQTPLLLFADLKTESDVDHFWFDTLPNRDQNENVTVQFRSQGLSLLGAKITAFTRNPDGSYREVANVTSDSADYLGDHLSVTFDGSDDDDDGPQRYFIRVERSESAPFAIGRFALSVSFDGLNTIPQANLDRVMQGAYDVVSPNDLARLLQDPDGALVNRDGGANETVGTATGLSPTIGRRGMSRAEAIGSLETDPDLDVYRVVAPTASQALVLKANVWAVTSETARPRLAFHDANGQALAASVLVNHDGSYSLQTTAIAPGSVIYVTVANQPTGQPGNYFLTVDFGDVPTTLQTFAEGMLPQNGSNRTDTLYIGQSQLFHFLLSADASAPAGSHVTMAVRDQNGNVVFQLTARAGETVSRPAVWLRPGEYRVTYTSSGNGTVPLAFHVRGNRITDPVGPVVDDPTLAPTYRDPTNPDRFQYPNQFITTNPYHWVVGVTF